METPKNNEAKVIEEQLQEVHPKQTEMTNTIKNPLDKHEIPDANKSEKKIRKNKRKQRKQISTKEIANSIIKDLSCCRPIRLGTWLLLVAILLISVLQFVIFYVYANSSGVKAFLAINRPFIWVFLVFSILYLFLFIYFLIKWKKIVKIWIRKKYDMTGNLNRNNNQIGTRLVRIYFDNLGINGRYYFYKLYLYEFIENFVQFSNWITIYTCTLPIEFVVLFSLLLISESFYRATFMYKKIWGDNINISVGERNFQIALDIFLDMFFLIVPLFVLWFGYRMPLEVSEILLIILMPSFSLFGKLRALFQHGLFHNVTEAIAKKQDEASGKLNRRRLSLFRKTIIEKITKMQNKYFPRKMKIAIFSISFIYGLLLSILLIVQLANLSSIDTCEDTFDNMNIWDKGCSVKIPFCKKFFSKPQCNCAFLKIKNNYEMKALPKQVTTEMDGLRKVYIKNGNLTTLPNNMENLVEMRDFEIAFNKLKAFNVDVRRWKKLVRLFLMYNNITYYNEEAIWTHPALVSLDLRDNIGLKMPGSDVKIAMPSLQYLNFMNNSVAIVTGLSNAYFPRLLFLYLDGNDLITFPDKSMTKIIIELWIARCNLLSLPNYMHEFEKLKYLDVRYNNISHVDTKLLSLMESNDMETYFAGNEIACNKYQKKLDCEPLCSMYCSSRNAPKNNYCDAECNSKECEYDGGDC